MNIKYKQLSVVGKIWRLAEMYATGIRLGDDAYLKATKRYLQYIQSYEKKSNAKYDDTISNMINYVSGNQSFVNDGSVVSLLWYYGEIFDDIKHKNKYGIISKEDEVIMDQFVKIIDQLYMDEDSIIYTSDGGVLYDGELVRAVMRFQNLNGFYEDGIIGYELIKALRKRK